MSMPRASMEASRALPPEEMNGRGTPSTGSRPVTTIMFTSAWPISQQVTPATVIWMKGSRARWIIRNRMRASRLNIRTTPRVPTSPSSSPMIAKM
jgi:hypothetical protein